MLFRAANIFYISVNVLYLPLMGEITVRPMTI